MQYEAAKVVTCAIKGTSRQRLLEELGWESMKTRRIIHRIVLFYKIVNNCSPHYSLRSSINFSVFATRTERFRNSFFPSAIALWNQLSTEIRNIESIRSFKKELKIYFNIVPYNILFDFSIDRYSSVLHTRLRLDACALNYYLFSFSSLSLWSRS